MDSKIMLVLSGICMGFGVSGLLFNYLIYRGHVPNHKLFSSIEGIDMSLGMILQMLNVMCIDVVSILDAVDTDGKAKNPKEVILSRN